MFGEENWLLVKNKNADSYSSQLLFHGAPCFAYLPRELLLSFSNIPET
jgi:hypothetical protein